MYSFIGSALCFSKYIDLQVCVGVWRNFRYHAFLYMVYLCTALPIWVKISSQWCIKKCTVHQQCVYCRMTSRPVNSRTTPLRGGVHDMNCSSAAAVQSTHSIRGRETGWVGDWLQCFLQNGFYLWSGVGQGVDDTVLVWQLGLSGYILCSLPSFPSVSTLRILGAYGIIMKQLQSNLLWVRTRTVTCYLIILLLVLSRSLLNWITLVRLVV